MPAGSCGRTAACAGDSKNVSGSRMDTALKQPSPEHYASDRKGNDQAATVQKSNRPKTYNRAQVQKLAKRESGDRHRGT